MANARKPDNVHKLNGTYQKHRHGDPDTKPDWNEGFPDTPTWLDKRAKAEWNRMKKVIPAGVVTHTDLVAFAQYCVLASELENDPSGFPSGKHSQLKLIQQELGFTPISRGKIGGSPRKDDGAGSFGRT